MDFQERKLYHQIHPSKLATDFGMMVPALYYLWDHKIMAAVLWAWVPPILVSAYLMSGKVNLEWLKGSVLGRYVKGYMTPLVEGLRFATLAPMAYGAWKHEPWFIMLGFGLLGLVWLGGLLFRRHPDH